MTCMDRVLPYTVFADFRRMGDRHKHLQWLFAPVRELSRRQARWYEILAEVDGEKLAEKGVVDRDTGEPRQSSPGESAKDPTPIDPASVFGVIDEDTDEPRQEPSEEPIKVSKIPNDPTFVLIDVMMFEHSDSDDGLVPPGFHRFKADGKDDVKLGGIVIYLKIQFENVGLDITSFDFRRRQ
eukprot:gene10668-12617_t